MADTRIADLDTLSPVDNADWVAVVDVSDTSDGADGTTKKAARSEFKGDKGDAGEQGPQGDPGTNGSNGSNAFVYIAYASDDSGSDFTMTFDAALNYIAILSTDTEIPSPAAGDFTGLWKNYKGATGDTGPQGPQGEPGADGTGSGDMLAATYDPNSVADDAFAMDNMVEGTDTKILTAAERTKLSNTSGTNTGDQTTVSGNAGTATALQTARTIDGQSFNGTANITVIAPGTHAASSKTTPVDADELSLVDSAASNVLKKLTWSNLKATLKTYLDTLYQPLDTDLTTIAGLTATTNNFIVSVSSAWASRTPAQVKSTLSLDNVDNTSNATERAATATLTNKRITKRTGTTTSSATPTINTDNVDFYSITALSAAITSFTTNLSGTPTVGQTLWIAITDDGTARSITWGASFEASTVALPTTTVISTRLDVGFVWNSVTSKWRCIAVS